MSENIKELHYLQFEENGDKYAVAPGGYGLGAQTVDQLQLINSSQLDETVKNGIYRCEGGTFPQILEVKNDGRTVFQYLYSVGYSIEDRSILKRAGVHHQDSMNWENEWTREMFSCMPYIEYRTSEHFYGAPVYTQLIPYTLTGELFSPGSGNDYTINSKSSQTLEIPIPEQSYLIKAEGVYKESRSESSDVGKLNIRCVPLFTNSTINCSNEDISKDNGLKVGLLRFAIHQKSSLNTVDGDQDKYTLFIYVAPNLSASTGNAKFNGDEHILLQVWYTKKNPFDTAPSNN